MTSSENFLNSNLFAIYGLGATGSSVLNIFKKKKTNFFAWDDDKNVRSLHKINKKYKKKYFENFLDQANYIVISPGINIKKTKFKKKLIKNKKKIITDLDLFYLLNPKIKTIVVTGSNGKSTTCKIIEHVLKKNNLDVKIGGNIGKPILELKNKKKTIIVIEASSFQLAYSKFVKPKYAIILNITSDHLDWHRTRNNYMKSKLKIFKNQNSSDYAFLNNKKLKAFYKRNKFKAKLKLIEIKNYYKIRKNIKNKYLKSEVNNENMSFVYYLSKKFNISDSNFFNYANSFKGLNHRHETIFQKNGKIFINDSKATNFEATKNALISNKNIYWIVGGLPKKGDKFLINKYKKNIIKSYIVGKNVNFFKKQLKGKIKFELSFTLKKALLSIFMEIDKNSNNFLTVLFSPASASYDQYKNFQDRGNNFKKLVKTYAKNYL